MKRAVILLACLDQFRRPQLEKSRSQAVENERSLAQARAEREVMRSKLTRNELAQKQSSITQKFLSQGKTYVFCNEKEKAEFISEPAKYAAK